MLDTEPLPFQISWKHNLIHFTIWYIVHLWSAVKAHKMWNWIPMWQETQMEVWTVYIQTSRIEMKSRPTTKTQYTSKLRKSRPTANDNIHMYIITNLHQYSNKPIARPMLDHCIRWQRLTLRICIGGKLCVNKSKNIYYSSW